MRMHVFSAQAPYQQLTSIALGDMPGWVTFSMDGQYAYPSSGEVIHAKTRKVLYLLQDEHYNTVSFVFHKNQNKNPELKHVF